MAKLNMGELEDHVGEWLFTVIPPNRRHGACVYGGHLKKKDGIFYIEQKLTSPLAAIEIKDKTLVYLDYDEALDAAGF